MDQPQKLIMIMEYKSSQKIVSLKALSDEDLTYVANNPEYHAMLQDVLSSIFGKTEVRSAVLKKLPPGIPRIDQYPHHPKDKSAWSALFK